MPHSLTEFVEKYSYKIMLKASHLPREMEITEVYPDADDIKIVSKEFDDYAVCMVSCINFMQSVLKRINQVSETPFILASDQNPNLSEKASPSKGWSEDELARLWIYDPESRTNGATPAVGQARLFIREVVEPKH